MIPFTYNMPCAVFCYWSTANCFSLAQTLMLRAPWIRDYLDIPATPIPGSASTASLPEKIDPNENPFKAILAHTRGESLEKVAISRDMIQANKKNSIPTSESFQYDEKKHEVIAVHPQRRPTKDNKG